MRRPALTLLLPLVTGVALAVACASEKVGNPGAPCDRASDCAPGLFCVERVCTDDLSRLDGGSVPTFDTGSEADPDAADGDEVDPDAPPPPDTGTPIDTGTPPDTRPMDSTPPVDTRPPMDTEPPVDTAQPPDTSMDDTAGD